MRYRFVDKILSLDPGRQIHCQFCWPPTLSIFEDHFPGFPVVPGVLLTEMMGQSAALCMESKEGIDGGAMLIRIKNAVFRNWVKPGEILDIHANILSVTTKIGRVSARTIANEKVMAEAELLFTFQSKDELGLPSVDPILEEFYQSNSN